MSEPAAATPHTVSLGANGASGAQSGQGGEELARGWRAREAQAPDVLDVAAAVAQLLTELGGTPPDAQALQQATRAVIENPELGCVLVADTPEGIVGVLATSWQHAIHVPGHYCLIQDLWVDQSWRSRGVGAGLLAALVERVRRDGIARIEVGLPSERFAELHATRSFYAASGFTPLGPRMRLVIA